MCCHIRSASVSRRRPIKLRKAPTLPPLAMLDLSKPGEREAHEFLLRATDPKDRMWTLLDVRRHGDVLLCVVRWAHPEQKMCIRDSWCFVGLLLVTKPRVRTTWFEKPR